MNRFLLAIPATAVLLLGLAAAQDLPPGPQVPHNHTFEDAHRFQVVQLVLDFSPGSWTPPHSHGGQGFVTVLNGEMTVREEGNETRYAAGETWVEHPGHFAEVGNPGSEDARILATFLLPEGAALTVAGQAQGTDLPPGPTVAQRADHQGHAPPSEFDLVQLLMVFESGSWTPLHSHGGHGYVTVLEGEMTVRVEGQDDSSYGAGDAWVEIPGEYAEVGNAGDSTAVIAVAFLLGKGEGLTTVR